MTGNELKRGTTQKYRSWIQFGFFLFVAFVSASNAFRSRGINLPFGEEVSLHAICPFGGVVSFWNLATLGTLVKKAHESSVVLAVIGIILAVLFGPVLCGWVCPLGTFQEWIGKIGRRITGKRFNTFVPYPLDTILRYLRYGVLIWVSWMTVVSGKLVFQDADPYYALFNFWSSEVSATALVFLGIIIVLSLFIERPFCKYFCPYGAFQGLFNLFRIFAVRRNVQTCISCKACDRTCPMNIRVSGSGTVRNHQCISCLKCSSEAACPVADTVTFTTPGFRWTATTPVLGLATVVILSGGIAVSAVLGKWNVSSTKQPALIRSGDFRGQPDPGDIRGSYTWDDVSRTFSVPSDLLVQAFGAGSSGEKVNSLEAMYAGKVPDGVEIGTDSVRLFVSLITALPYEPEPGTVLPPSAVPVVIQYAKADRELVKNAVTAAKALNISGSPLETAPADSPVPDIPAASKTTGTEPAVKQQPVSTQGAPSITVTGKTTFRDLEAAGFNMKKVEAITGPFPDPGATVKSVCEKNGVEFSEVKAKLPELY